MRYQWHYVIALQHDPQSQQVILSLLVLVCFLI